MCMKKLRMHSKHWSVKKEPQYIDTVLNLDQQANCALKKNHTWGKQFMTLQVA